MPIDEPNIIEIDDSNFMDKGEDTRVSEDYYYPEPEPIYYCDPYYEYCGGVTK